MLKLNETRVGKQVSSRDSYLDLDNEHAPIPATECR